MKYTACLILFGALSATLLSCSTTKPQWTPESVAPPKSPDGQIEPAVALEQRATLSSPQDTGAGGAVRLTRDGALLTALSNNRAIEVARYNPRIGATYVPEARAVFDPSVSGSISVGHDSTKPVSTLASSAGTSSRTTGSSSSSSSTSSTAQSLFTKVDTNDTTGSASLQEILPTGTQLYLTGTATDSNTTGTGDRYQGGWTVGMTQPLLDGAGTGVNLVGLRQARNKAAQTEHSFRASVLDVTRQVEVGYWELVLANQLTQIREFAVGLADEQLKRNEERFRVGKAIEGDVMAAKAERATRAADLTDAQAAIRSRNIAIIRLMNPASGAEAWTTQYEPVDPADVIQVALEPAVCEQLAIKYRPELAQARLDVANLQLEKTRTKNALLPKLDFVASYGLKSQGTYPNAISNELDNSDYDNYRVGLQFQTPILNRAERAKNTRSKLLAEQGERSLSNLEQALGAEVRQAAVEVQKQWERIAATESALKSRVEQLRVAQGRFDAGKTTNLDLMIVQRDFIQSQVDAVTARVRYIQALTALYAAEGTLLDRRGITMDFVAKSAQPGM